MKNKVLTLPDPLFVFVLFCYDHLSIVVFRSLCIYYYAVHIFQCSLLESQAVIKGGESPAGGGEGCGSLASGRALPQGSQNSEESSCLTI